MNQSIPLTSLATRDFNLETDFAGLTLLYQAVEDVDHNDQEFSEATLRAVEGVERWVIEDPLDPSAFIGHGWRYEQSRLRSYLYVAVHPTWRRQGLGSVLLSNGLARIQGHGTRQVVAVTRADNATGDAFLRYNGFIPAGHNRRFSVPAGIEIPEVKWPVGYTLSRYSEVQQLAILVEAHNRCYMDRWGHNENTETLSAEKLLGWINEYPDYFIPEGTFIVFAPDGSLAGLSHGRLERENSQTFSEPRKIVDSPGVVPEHRHLELQRPLTITTMRWLRQYGEGPIELDTFGEEEETVRIYDELGFTLEDKNHTVEYVLNFS